MVIAIILIILFVISGLLTVMTRSLLKSAIALGLTSAILAIIMFNLNSALAAVFELSVCTGLISVVFISAISLVQRRTKEEKFRHKKERLRKFIFLPILVIFLGIMLSLTKPDVKIRISEPEKDKDVRGFMWNQRQLDIIGQILILLAGGIGVVVLFREKDDK